MATTSIATLTHQMRRDIIQLNLPSTLPTKLNRIQSLQRFQSLTILNLSNNNITRIQNLSHLKKLKTLNLQFNQIKVVQNIDKLVSLEQLLLSYNAISSISSRIIQNVRLKVIDLSYNMLDSIDTIQPLFNLNIESLCLQGNSFISKLNYITFIKTVIPSLVLLDNKNINVPVQSPFYGELNAEEQVLVLRDTLNKLLEERNYLAEELQNLTNVTSPAKINLKDYLKYHSFKEGQSLMKSGQGKQCEQLNVQESQVKISTFSPIKHIETKLSAEKNNTKSNNIRSLIQAARKNKQQETLKIKGKQQQQIFIPFIKQRQKMLQILQYWRGKLQQKMLIKKREVDGLHQYYANGFKMKKLRESQKKEHFEQDGHASDDEFEDGKDKKSIEHQQDASNNKSTCKREKNSDINNDRSKELLNRIKSQQKQVHEIKSQIHSISTLIKEIRSLPLQEQLYKTIMMRVLFGNRDKETSKRRQVNYRQLKRFLLSDYGLLNVVNDLGRVIFGEEGVEFAIDKINSLKQLTSQKSLIEMATEYKQQVQQVRREKKQFEKQRKLCMKRLEQQSQELCDKWREFNQAKTQYQLEKGSQLRYENKLIQQKEIELQSKLQELSAIQCGRLQQIQQHKQQLQNDIYILQEKLEQLESQHERSSLELHQMQQHIQTISSNKEELNQLDTQLSQLKKLIFTKQNLLQEKTQTIKHLLLEEQIVNERVNFLEKKCSERMLQVKQMDEEERKLTQKINQLREQQKNKSLLLSTVNNKLTQLHQQQCCITKQTQRHRQNLILFEQKLANLNELQSHKKKSIQQLELQNAELKTISLQLNQKNSQLESIIIQKEDIIHAYLTKINQHKTQLETYTDLNKNMHSLIQRQAELKSNILQLQIQNGNLLDLKSQLMRQNKTHQFPIYTLKQHWV